MKHILTILIISLLLSLASCGAGGVVPFTSDQLAPNPTAGQALYTTGDPRGENYWAAAGGAGTETLDQAYDLGNTIDYTRAVPVKLLHGVASAPTTIEGIPVSNLYISDDYTFDAAGGTMILQRALHTDADTYFFLTGYQGAAGASSQVYYIDTFGKANFFGGLDVNVLDATAGAPGDTILGSDAYNAVFVDASANCVSIVPTEYIGDNTHAGTLYVANGSGAYKAVTYTWLNSLLASYTETDPVFGAWVADYVPDNYTVKATANDSASNFLTAALSAGAGITLGTVGASGTDQTTSITCSITQYTNALARAAISNTATGLTYTSGTGVLSLTSGYVVPTTTEETIWNNASSGTYTTLTATGGTVNAGTATQAGTIDLYSNGHKAAFTIGSLAGDTAWTWPATHGSTGKYLGEPDGDGVLAWGTLPTDTDNDNMIYSCYSAATTVGTSDTLIGTLQPVLVAGTILRIGVYITTWTVATTTDTLTVTLYVDGVAQGAWTTTVGTTGSYSYTLTGGTNTVTLSTNTVSHSVSLYAKRTTAGSADTIAVTGGNIYEKFK